MARNTWRIQIRDDAMTPFSSSKLTLKAVSTKDIREQDTTISMGFFLSFSGHVSVYFDLGSDSV